jgi:hypothetical protein
MFIDRSTANELIIDIAWRNKRRRKKVSALRPKINQSRTEPGSCSSDSTLAFAVFPFVSDLMDFSDNISFF